MFNGRRGKEITRNIHDKENTGELLECWMVHEKGKTRNRLIMNNMRGTVEA